MGLDITIYKPLPYINLNISEIDPNDYIVLDEKEDMSFFEEYIFEKENLYYDIEKAILDSGNNPDEVTNLSQQYNGIIFLCFFTTKNGFEISVTPETFSVIEKCIIPQEIGYQRKGANKKFYDDGIWDSNIITSEKILIEHWDLYFSKDKESKENFRKNILDKFVEGQTFVIYH